MTSELFAQLIVSDAVVNRIRDYRAKLPELDRLKGEIKTREDLIAANPDPKSQLNAGLEGEIKELQSQCRAITNIKSGLPVLMYQATFDKTVSKKGYEGYWRKQSAARLNGLFMLDVDHIGAQLPLPSEGAGGRFPLSGIIPAWVGIIVTLRGERSQKIMPIQSTPKAATWRMFSPSRRPQTLINLRFTNLLFTNLRFTI
jgi:hypothetical protein